MLLIFEVHEEYEFLHKKIMIDPKPPRSKVQTILEARCPRCREGKMFSHSAWSGKFAKMPKNCETCGLRFELQPSFFDGAMYISYAFSVAIMITFGFGTYILGGDPPMWVYITVVISAVLLLFRMSFRYSRVLMLHLFGFIKYETPEDRKRREMQSLQQK